MGIKKVERNFEYFALERRDLYKEISRNGYLAFLRFFSIIVLAFLIVCLTFDKIYTNFECIEILSRFKAGFLIR